MVLLAGPEQKIRDRYGRNGPIIRQAMLLCNQGHVFDNFRLNTPPERIIGFTLGQVTCVKPELPVWAIEIYQPDLLRQPCHGPTWKRGAAMTATPLVVVTLKVRS